MIFALNKNLLLDEINPFQNSLAEFKYTLENEDEKTMKDMMTLSTKRRKKFD